MLSLGDKGAVLSSIATNSFRLFTYYWASIMIRETRIEMFVDASFCSLLAVDLMRMEFIRTSINTHGHGTGSNKSH